MQQYPTSTTASAIAEGHGGTNPLLYSGFAEDFDDDQRRSLPPPPSSLPMEEYIEDEDIDEFVSAIELPPVPSAVPVEEDFDVVVNDDDDDDDDDGLLIPQQPQELPSFQQRQQHQQHQQQKRPYTIPIPDMVKQFVCYFDRYIKERNVFEIQSMYESSFNRISEKFFKNSPWPSAEIISPLVNNG